ncbi:MAG: hypothetical protein JJV99_06955 [Colwellia sp.]|nr:hypothetical protein [Colwellia sp.]
MSFRDKKKKEIKLKQFIAYILFCIISCTLLLGCSDQETNSSPINKKIFNQNFESFPFQNIPQWIADPIKNTGPYSEAGEYYKQLNIKAPDALRNTVPIGQQNWLMAELYTRTKKPIITDYLEIINDPLNINNKVLKISTPKHTDGVILRPTEALPKKYKLSFKIGFANYGDSSELNGYDTGNETAEPWRKGSSVGDNGFYWLAIMDKRPIPHNNIWSHHHRKFVIGSWNRKSQQNTVNVIALNGTSETHEAFGKSFISYIDRTWQKVNDIPIDYYLPKQWYTVTFTRTSLFYNFSITGNFKNAGLTTYTNKINLREHCIFHYNQTPEEQSSTCVDNRTQTFLGKKFVSWPINSYYPDYFMIGDPHINYYEGSFLIDDITLETL